jgi:plasmid stabilization system protein ParE
MRIRWTVPAADDLQNIKDYLQKHYPHFAEPTVRAIYQRIRLLKTSPNSGRPGHRSGTPFPDLNPPEDAPLLSRFLRQGGAF